jgi:hypothetical protein
MDEKTQDLVKCFTALHEQNKEYMCSCGENEWSRQYDRYGIYCGKMCDKCFQEKYDWNYIPQEAMEED